MRIRAYNRSVDLDQLRSLGFPERLIKRYCCLGVFWRALALLGVSADELFITTPKDSEQVIGTLVLNRRLTVRRPGRTWRIHGVFVVPQWRRQGLAEAMLKHVFATLVRRHVDRVTLKVDPANTGAIALYEKCGFVLMHRTDGAAVFVKHLV